MSAIHRAVTWILNAHDVRHPKSKDAKPDLLALVNFARKADAALRWTRNASCECGKIENETGICPVCEALNFAKENK